MNHNQTKNILTALFFGAFAILCLLVTGRGIFKSPYHETAKLLPLTLLLLAVFAGVFYLVGRYEIQLAKCYKTILTVFCLVMLIVQLVTGNILRYNPIYDVGAVYHGAVEWATTGSFPSQYDYFEWFPNNLGAMSFLSFFFYIANALGITDFFMVAVVVNSLLSVSTIATTSLVLRKLRGEVYGIFALCVFALSLPFYIIGAVFYTDALSMLFPVLFYFLYLKLKEEIEQKRRIKYYILMGLVAAIGMQIKFTVLIGVIAVIIDMIFSCDWKKTLTVLGSTGLIVLLVSSSVNGIIYSNHLDKEFAEKKNTPYTHWIMMGLHNNGAYNGTDYEFTRGFADVEERNEAIRDEIVRTVKERGAWDLSKLFLLKLSTDFGDGTYGLADCVSCPHEEDTALHQFVTYNGQYYKGYGVYCASLQLALLTFITLGAFYRIFGKNKGRLRLELAPFVSLFGLMLFLMLWETNKRYFSNFVPMLFVAALLSIGSLVQRKKETK